MANDSDNTDDTNSMPMGTVLTDEEGVEPKDIAEDIPGFFEALMKATERNGSTTIQIGYGIGVQRDDETKEVIGEKRPLVICRIAEKRPGGEAEIFCCVPNDARHIAAIMVRGIKEVPLVSSSVELLLSLAEGFVRSADEAEKTNETVDANGEADQFKLSKENAIAAFERAAAHKGTTTTKVVGDPGDLRRAILGGLTENPPPRGKMH